MSEQTAEGGRGGVHERYLEPIGDFGDDGALGQKTEEALSDDVGQREHEDAERDHLRR